MLHKEIIGLAVLLFLGWIFVSSSGTERIQHFCAPVGWVGNVAVSAAALSSPDSQKALGKTMDKVVYGCEYMTWRLFYQANYNEYMQSRGRKGTNAPAPEVRTDLQDAEAPLATSTTPVQADDASDEPATPAPTQKLPKPAAAADQAPAPVASQPAAVPAKPAGPAVRVIE